jgi:hypothetical protein
MSRKVPVRMIGGLADQLETWSPLHRMSTAGESSLHLATEPRPISYRTVERFGSPLTCGSASRPLSATPLAEAEWAAAAGHWKRAGPPRLLDVALREDAGAGLAAVARTVRWRAGRSWLVLEPRPSAGACAAAFAARAARLAGDARGAGQSAPHHDLAHLAAPGVAAAPAGGAEMAERERQRSSLPPHGARPAGVCGGRGAAGAARGSRPR